MRVHPLHRSALLGLALLCATGAPAWGQPAADRQAEPTPEEVQAFRDAAARFSARLSEMEEDTRRYVSLREGEQRAAVSKHYDSVITELAEEDRERREAAIARLEDFLARHPDSPQASSMRFRLAEVYYERAAERYLAESRRYYTALESNDLEVLEDLVEPKLDMSRSIEQYQRIIDDNLALPRDQRWDRLDGAFVMLGFSHYETTSAQRDEERAKEVFRQLIAEIPESELADRSYLYLGDAAFDDSRYEEAIEEYSAVLAKGPGATYYYEALYKLAWARFKLDDFEDALQLFTELLDHSERMRAETGRESSVAPDSRRFMAFSFADIANRDLRDAVDVANAYFAAIGRRPYEHEVYVQLADVLKRYGRIQEVIGVYQYLQEGPPDAQPSWKWHPDNPKFQDALVLEYSRGLFMDLERAGEERLKLTQRYGETSEWWSRNKNNPEALAVARGIIESELLEVAREYLVRAQFSETPADYMVAAAKFADYLDTFPIADDYYEQQWFLAYALKEGGDWAGAAAEFEKLFRSRRYHPFGDGALYELTNARLQVTLARTGATNAGCEGCKIFKEGTWVASGEGPAALSVERTYASKGNNPEEIPVYALTADREAFLEALDVLVSWQWSEVDPRDLPENFPDYQGAFTELRHRFMYLGGQILYYHNRFDEARKRFEQVIAEYPRTDEASYSAGLIVDSYVAEGDLLQVRNATKRFSTMILGPSDVPSDRFQSVLEKSSFELANDLGREKQYIEAAEAFLAYMAEFPTSENLPMALNNAAYYYSQAGKKEQANELYEQFVNRYPRHENSKKLYYVIAGNYEAIFNLERAVDYYMRLHREFPDYVDAADALWNASFLNVGLGNHRAAAEGYELYARSYPDRADREDTFWRAGEQWEKVSDDLALRFYRRYLDQYGLQNPDHAIEAEYRIATILAGQGNTRAHERQLDKIVETYARVQAAGGQVGAAGVNIAAAADFRNLQKAYDDLVKDKLTGNEDRDLVLLEDTKPNQLKAFEAATKDFVVRYPGAFEWNSGAFYLQGMAALYLADLGLSIRCPPSFAAEDCWAYEEILEEKVFPKYYAVQDVGVQKLKELVEGARQQKKHSPFIDEALAELNRRDPLAWPGVKQEVRRTMKASAPIKLVPRDANGRPISLPAGSPRATPASQSRGSDAPEPLLQETPAAPSGSEPQGGDQP